MAKPRTRAPAIWGAIAAVAGLALAGGALARAEPKVLSGVGLENSEAARYDAIADLYLVSNLGQRGVAGDGFITQIAPDGAVVSAKWIAGGVGGAVLNDPLGILIAGEVIYAADPAAVRKFDRRTGKYLGSVEVPGANRLNDLAMARDGTLYVTDSGTDDKPGAIYKIARNGRVSTFVAPNEALERPNGVAVMPDGTIVHGGRGVNLVFRAPDGRILRERTLPSAQIDGIVALPDGSLLAAAQMGHAVYRAPPVGKPVVVASDIPAPAAIGYDSKRNRLLVPQITAASVTLIDLP